MEYPFDFEVKSECVSEAFRYLLQRKNATVREVARETGLPENSLYGINSRHCDRADMRILKVLADYFGEDITIFCGLDCYVRPKELSKQEKDILDICRELNAEARQRAYALLSDIAANPANQGS